MGLAESIAVGVALTASIFDLHSRRIPNALTFGAALAAFLVSGITGGLAGVGGSLTAWIIATALWLPIYALGGMGAGDVKLMAAVGAWLGPENVIYAALYAAVAGAVMAMAIAIVRGRVRQTFSNVQLLLNHWQVVGFTPHAQLTLETSTSARLAYAVPIFAGTVAAVWLR